VRAAARPARRKAARTLEGLPRLVLRAPAAGFRGGDVTNDEGRPHAAATLIAIAVALIAAVGAPPAISAQAGTTASIESLAWMGGSWKGSLGKAAIEEHWIQPAGKTMLAVSRTVVGDRTAAFEFLRIEERADGVYYVAQPQGRPPTDFKLTSVSGHSAVFENPQHDMPKIIRYRRDGTTLVAEIEGDEKGKHVKQAFTFTLVQ
jgi:hypothetical protein